MSSTHAITMLLEKWAKGDEQALEELTPLVYRELRRLAAAHLRKEKDGSVLQPTALVHETYLRLVDQSHSKWESRSHFYGVAARLMRQILVDNARRRNARKRAFIKIPLDQAVSFAAQRSGMILALDSGLTALEKLDPRKSKVVELRYFGGLSMDEIARTLQLSENTVRHDLRLAEAWLHREIRTR